MDKSIFAGVKQLVDDYKAARKAFSEKAKESFEPMFKGIFEQFPDAQAIRWAQWIPGFNDGDACEFTVGEVAIIPFKNAEGEDISLATLKEDYDDDFYEFNSYYLERDHGKPELAQLARELDKVLDSMSDVLEGMFESNAEIIVTRDGIQTNDYDCGY